MRDAKILQFPTRGQRESLDALLRAFGERMQKGDTRAAADILSLILGLDHSTCLKASDYCFRSILDDPSLVATILALPSTVMDESPNHSLGVLYRCFHIQGPPALFALQTLKNQAR